MVTIILKHKKSLKSKKEINIKTSITQTTIATAEKKREKKNTRTIAQKHLKEIISPPKEQKHFRMNNKHKNAGALSCFTKAAVKPNHTLISLLFIFLRPFFPLSFFSFSSPFPRSSKMDGVSKASDFFFSLFIH